jgi:hypothetical protein
MYYTKSYDRLLIYHVTYIYLQLMCFSVYDRRGNLMGALSASDMKNIDKVIKLQLDLG